MIENNQNSTKVLEPQLPKRSLKEKFFHLLRLTHQPTVKVYRGYGHAGHITLYGQVFSLSPLGRKKYRRNIWTNAFSLLRLFIVEPLSGVKVRLNWNNEVIESETEKDGFFKMEWD